MYATLPSAGSTSAVADVHVPSVLLSVTSYAVTGKPVRAVVGEYHMTAAQYVLPLANT